MFSWLFCFESPVETCQNWNFVLRISTSSWILNGFGQCGCYCFGKSALQKPTQEDLIFLGTLDLFRKICQNLSKNLNGLESIQVEIGRLGSRSRTDFTFRLVEKKVEWFQEKRSILQNFVFNINIQMIWARLATFSRFQ